MNINEGFETPEEAFMRRSAEREACVNGVDDLNNDSSVVEQLTLEAERLGELLVRIGEEGAFSRGYAIEADAITNGGFSKIHPIGAFTTVPSKMMYRQANESLVKQVGKAIMAGLKTLGELVMKLVRWVKSFFTKENKEDIEAVAKAAEEAEQAAKDAGADQSDKMADFMDHVMQEAKKNFEEMEKMQTEFDHKSKEMDETIKQSDANLEKAKEELAALKEKIKQTDTVIEKMSDSTGGEGHPSASDSSSSQPADATSSSPSIQELQRMVDEHRERVTKFNKALDDVLAGKTPSSTNKGINSLVELMEFPEQFPAFYQFATDKTAYTAFYGVVHYMVGPDFKRQVEALSWAASTLTSMAAEWKRDQGKESDPMVEDSLAAFNAAYLDAKKNERPENTGASYKASSNLIKLLRLVLKTSIDQKSEIEKHHEQMKARFMDLTTALQSNLAPKLDQSSVAFADLYRAAVRFEVNDLTKAMREISGNESIVQTTEKLMKAFEDIKLSIEAAEDASGGTDANQYHHVITLIHMFAGVVQSIFYHQTKVASLAEKFLEGYIDFQARVASTAEKLASTDTTKKFKKDMLAIRNSVHTRKW